MGTIKVQRGSIAWTPLRLKISIFPQRQATAAQEASGVPQAYTIDRDRIFDYLRTHRLPGERARQLRRDLRNRVDFISDVRELQTFSEVEPL